MFSLCNWDGKTHPVSDDRTTVATSYCTLRAATDAAVSLSAVPRRGPTPVSLRAATREGRAPAFPSAALCGHTNSRRNVNCF